MAAPTSNAKLKNALADGEPATRGQADGRSDSTLLGQVIASGDPAMIQEHRLALAVIRVKSKHSVSTSQTSLMAKRFVNTP